MKLQIEELHHQKLKENSVLKDKMDMSALNSEIGA